MASCTPRAVASVLLAFVLVLLPGAPRASAEGGLVTSDLASDLTPEDLVDTLLAEDSGITIVPGTVQYTGAPAAAGLFGGGEEAIGFDAGIILSTGNVANVVGPNDHDGVTGNHERAGYAPLTTIAGVDTRDAALLAFDFVPEGNKIAFIYVFGSEEYNEFVNNVNDAFAFFVNGTNYAQVTTLDGSVVPITINTINSGNPYSATGATGANPEYYRNNDLDDGGPFFDTEMDGLTTVLALQAPVNPGETNHVTIAIADAYDSYYDSNVFIKERSFTDRSADLSLAMNASVVEASVGEQVTFGLEAANAGPYTVNATRVRAKLPAELTLVSATPSVGSYDAATGVWDVGSLAVDGSATLEIVAQVSAADATLFSAEVIESDRLDPDSTPNNGIAGEDDQKSVRLNYPNSAPTGATLAPDHVSENTTDGALVGYLAAIDADETDTHVFTLTDDAGGRFVIDNNQLRVGDASLIDYETAASHDISVRVTDTSNEWCDQPLTVGIDDGEEPNAAPTDIALDNDTITEDAADGARIGTLTTTDADEGDTHTYSLVAGPGSTDNTLFSITDDALFLETSLDYETRASLSVRVRTTDARGAYYEEAFTITVSDVNEAPSNVALDHAEVAENLPSGTVVGELTTVDPDAGDSHSYTLVSGAGDADNAAFAIDAGRLVTAQEFDHETRASYTVRVRATDSGGLWYERALTVTVRDQNEAPTDIHLSDTHVAEDSHVGAVVGDLSATDADDLDTHTYSLVSGLGADDNASFIIIDDTLRLATSLDYETRSGGSVRVRATDAGGLGFEKVFAITVTDINEAPTAVSLDPTVVDENAPIGTVVGTLCTIDPDVGDSHSYTLVSGVGDAGNAAFAIVVDTLVTSAEFDHEAAGSHTIRVRSTDAGGLHHEASLTIAVGDVSEAPTDIDLDDAEVAEDAAHGTAVGTFSAIDVDVDDAHTYTLVSGAGDADNASFTIDGSALLLATTLDYETKSSYSVRVRATDAGGAFREEAFAIAVTNVNESPTAVTLDGEVAEDAPIGAVAGVLGATDPDRSDTHTYDLVSGTGDADNGSFTVSGGELLLAVRCDYETRTSYSVRVRATDAGGLSYEQALIIAVTDVNEAPSDLALSGTEVAEDADVGTVVGALSTIDPDASDTHTYTLVSGDGGTDNAWYHITDDALLLASALDYEAQSSLSVRVRSTDAGGLYHEEALTIAVTDVNEAPTDLALSSTAVLDGADAGAVVGTLSTTDADGADSHTYTLVGGVGSDDNRSFSVAEDELRLAVPTDYETQDRYAVRLRTTDADGLYHEEALTITVTDVNEAPVAVDDTVTTMRGASVEVDVVANDADVDGDALSVIATTPPSRGTVVAIAPGVLRYTPTAAFTGSDAFSYVVSDGALSDTARVTVTVMMPRDSERPGAVRGVAFEDANGDGLANAGEARLPDVEISLHAAGHDQRLGTADDTLIATTDTGVDGAYEFAGVTPGTYLVREQQPAGYASATPDDVPVEVPPDGVTVADFGEQRIGAVTGVVYDDRNGDGRQDAGETGLAGVTVQLYAPGDDRIVGTPDDTLLATVTTDDDGRFTFSGRTAGRYHVREIDPDGYASVTPNDVLVTLEAGRAASARFADGRLGTISGVVFEDRDGDGARDTGEAGIAEVRVRLFGPGGDGRLGSGDDVEVASALTDAAGEYAFTGLAAGAYRVVETDPPGKASTTANAVAARVAAGVAHVSFGDTDTGRVVGRVYVDLNGSGAWDAGEQGMVAVSVRLLAPGKDGRLGTADDREVAAAQTDALGAYGFDAEPGPYVVRMTTPQGYGGTSPNPVAVSLVSGPSAVVDLGVQAQGTISGVSFDDLNGNGRQELGEPGVGGAVVMLFDVGDATQALASITSAANGTFFFAGIDPGVYRVVQTSPEGYVCSDACEVEVTLVAGAAATARFANLIEGSVSGTVFNDLNGDGQQDGGEPGLGGVRVRLGAVLSSASPSADGVMLGETLTTGDGHYRFLGVDVGSYTVQYDALNGFVGTSAPRTGVVITSGSAGSAAFGQQPVGSIAGTVFDDADRNGRRDASERGIGGVRITLAGSGEDGTLGTDDDTTDETVTAGNGSYAFAGLAAGCYLVREVDPIGYGSVSVNTVEVTIAEDGAAVAHFADRSALRNVPGSDTVLYLPSAYVRGVRAPDLVVDTVSVTTNDAVVVVRNTGNAAVADAFWVDLYMAPRSAPTGTNQPWDALGEWGLAWGVAGEALPLAGGATLTLRIGDPYYVAEYSAMPASLAAGATLYVQVDSAAYGSRDGAVIEGHEILGGAYNNTEGPLTLEADVVWPTPSLHMDGAASAERPAAIR